MDKQIYYCEQCGSTIQPNSSFCQACGAKQSGGTAPSENRVGEAGTIAHEKIKFPIAAILYILLAPASLLISFVLTRSQFQYYGGSMSYILLTGAVLTFFIRIFVAIVLLLKKSGSLLVFAVGALAVSALIGLIPIISIMVRNMFFDASPLILGLLPYLCILGMALYCTRKKGASHFGIVAKLWFVPAILNVIPLCQFLFTAPRSGISVDILIIEVFFGLLHSVAILLLGHWIPYIYSVKLPPKKAPVYGDTHTQYAPQPAAAQTSPARFCGACGSEILGSNAFCPACGSKLSEQLTNSMQTPSRANHAYGGSGYVQDVPSSGFAVLSAFFPVVGLILYLVWRETLPLRAKSAGKGAIIGAIVYVGLIILSVIVQVVLMMSFLR